MSYVDASAGPQRRFHARVTTRSFACCAGGRPIWAIMVSQVEDQLEPQVEVCSDPKVDFQYCDGRHAQRASLSFSF